MSDGDGDPAAAAGLERPLAELAPLLRRAAAQEPDPALVRALRARLVAAPSTAPPPRSRPRQAQRGRRALGQVVLVAAALATLLALAVAVVAPEFILVFLLVAAIVTIVLGWTCPHDWGSCAYNVKRAGGREVQPGKAAITRVGHT